ncbi:MAG: hypothetical protein KBD52_02865 [Candidatus Pacebacteria bacterium]|nr:hypothetical protein [Candidatus Paceibacterota bacterium]
MPGNKYDALFEDNKDKGEKLPQPEQAVEKTSKSEEEVAKEQEAREAKKENNAKQTEVRIGEIKDNLEKAYEGDTQKQPEGVEISEEEISKITGLFSYKINHMSELYDNVAENYTFDKELDDAFNKAKESPVVMSAVEKTVTEVLGDKVRLIPMMGGGAGAKAIIEKLHTLMPEVVENAVAKGLQEMTTYENKDIPAFSQDVMKTKDALSISNEYTAHLLNKGLELLIANLKKVQEQNTVTLANEKISETEKIRIQEQMKSIDSYIEQQKQRTTEITKEISSNS